MPARFEVRRRELLDECQVPDQVFQKVLPRLQTFLQPFLQHLCRCEQYQHLTTYVQGLLSDVEDKNVESIAYRFGQPRLPLQRFIGFADWPDQPFRHELARQVGQQLGEDDAVLVLDPSAFAKSGKQSVGVARQYCSRLGKVENCQVGIFLGYASRHEHTLVDMRLYLPKEWTQDQERCEQAGIPKDQRRHRTRHQLCLDMLADKGPLLPHAWVAGDDELGKVYSFRRNLDAAHEQYLLAIPSNLLIRDQDRPPPEYSGRGPRPKRPWQRVSVWAASVPDHEWTSIEVRPGAKGPLQVEVTHTRVVGRQPNRQEGHEEVLVVIRYRDRDQQTVVQTDYYLANASAQTSREEFARVAKAAHRIEECLQRAKSEAGLADYEVRTWKGWHHHMTLTLLATWFLVTETRRGKKMDAGADVAANPGGDRGDHPPGLPLRYERAYALGA